MIQGIIIWLITLLLSYLVIGNMSQLHSGSDRRFMMILFFYHSLLAVSYYLYALSNPSDSVGYFGRVLALRRGEDWLDYFGVSTIFIEFVNYPLVHGLGFTYESSMVFFSWLGFLGFLFFYLFFLDNTHVRPKIFGFNGIMLLLLLPNLHFWSSSLGKGSLIFFGFGLFFFGLSRPAIRFWALIVGEIRFM